MNVVTDGVRAAQEEACVRCLSDFERAAANLSRRRAGAFRDRLHHLLQTLTVTTRSTIDDASERAIADWLAPALGLHEHDTRVDLLDLLSTFVRNPALAQPRQVGRAVQRRLREVVFWRQQQAELHRRTRGFFERITQEEILQTEIACTPFYRALSAVYPGLESGEFCASDELVVRLIGGHTPPAAPAILDVGCGRGRLLARLRRAHPDASLTGTSIFPFSLAEREHLDRHDIRPIYCAAHRIDVPDSSQDVVVSTEVIEHLRDPAALVREIFRVLRPGGVFCVTAPGKIAAMYNRNPLSYLAVATSALWPGVLPPFHDLYAPLTPLPIVHYGFDLDAFAAMFAPFASELHVLTTRFTALEKFGLAELAPRLPVLRRMGGLCVAAGTR